MKKFLLTDAVSKCYDKIDENTINLKSGFLGVCSEIDRFFSVSVNLDINNVVPDYYTYLFKTHFPNLINLSYSLLEEIRCVYNEIRNVNAHLYISKPINVSTNLINSLTEIVTPNTVVLQNGELTMYGMMYVLSFLSQKHLIKNLIEEFIDYKYFFDAPKKDISNFKNEIYNCLKNCCGVGKTKFSVCEGLETIDVQNLNDLCRRSMTKIFFALEKNILKWVYSSKREPAFSYLLFNNKPFSNNKNLAGELVKLRNSWFHGNSLFDKVVTEKFHYTFDLNFITRVFIKLKKLLEGNEEYAYVVELLSHFGEKLVTLFIGRIVELSYKLLDKTLLTEDKVNSRITDVNSAVLRFEKVLPSYYENAVELIGGNEITCSLGVNRFADIKPRVLKTNLLHIIKITANNNIKIGDFQSNSNTISLALVDVENENLNDVNGLNIYDIAKSSINEKYYSPKICVKTINI